MNISKFNVMHFRRGHLPRSAFYNQPLPIVEQYRYLGVIFHEKMKFREAAETLPKGGGRALRAAIFEIGFKTFESLFYSCVTPVLDYCSGVWDFNNFSCVDNVQNRALRYFLGLHRFTPHLVLSCEVGWLPSTERRWQICSGCETA